MAAAPEAHDRVQSDLDFETPIKVTRGKLSAAVIGAELVSWLPLAALLALLAQVGIRGLRPAMAEQGQLRIKEEQLEAQYAAAVDQQLELEMRIKAQDDPIYLERMRRLRLQEELGETGSQ